MHIRDIEMRAAHCKRRGVDLLALAWREETRRVRAGVMIRRDARQCTTVIFFFFFFGKRFIHSN